MSTAVTVKPVRKFPPPCWTRDEALVLIQAYRERWYALHRAFLKNPDWDAVADKVTTACPDVTPPKTSAQCRHKMEKLRQRYRAEKLRASSFPGGRFFSSWFYFEAMEAMENGPNADPEADHQIDSVPDHRSLIPGHGVRIKPSIVENLVTLAKSPNFESRVSNHGSGYMNSWSGLEDENNEGYKNHKQARKVSKVGHEHWKPRVNEGKKKKRGIHEVVSSIKVLGEGFMKMEKMKIDMAREIERMRMETEMKRNQLILESQKQIVDAFLKGMVAARKQPRTEMMD